MELKAPASRTYYPWWRNARMMLRRAEPLCNPDRNSNANAFLQTGRVLVIGAGGLGCEILKNLAVMGFSNLHILDMDVVNVSNLSRQFVFREKDVGHPKSEVVAKYVSKRVKNCHITAYYNKIQDFSPGFYQSFDLVVSGLGSVTARQWINEILLSLVTSHSARHDGPLASVIPFVDRRSGGFKGSCRVMHSGGPSRANSTANSYSAQTSYPLCNLENTPRLPEHCVEYVKLILWPRENPWGRLADLDGDNPLHVSWVYEKSMERAHHYAVPGLSYRLVHELSKNVVPIVVASNEILAAVCADEAYKNVTNTSNPLSNLMIYNDVDGIYCYSYSVEQKVDCVSCCTCHKEIEVQPDVTLSELIEFLCDIPNCHFVSPTVLANVGGRTETLYVHNAPNVEDTTRDNLPKTLTQLGLVDGTEIALCDRLLPSTVTFALRYPQQ